MIKKFEIFEGNNYSFKEVYYKIIKKSGDKVIFLVTDYLLLNSDNDSVEVKAKGYEKVNGKWEEFDDFLSEETHNFNKDCFKSGKMKIKIS